jgi:hypothetical protein
LHTGRGDINREWIRLRKAYGATGSEDDKPTANGHELTRIKV